ncbi:MAG: bifunctional riboflavin kinase/FAD synthetase [Sediminibacterium sp.]
MKVHYDLKKLPPFKNAVITTGAFDGVHIGHLQIIKRIKEIAHEVDGESIIITFHPHPRKIISSIPGEIKQLTCIDERIQLLAQAKIDHLVVINFDYLFSNLTANEYVQDFLVAHFHPHTIIVGYDHHFGKGRMGDFNLLVTLGELHHFKVVEINEQLFNKEIISSTLIRQYLLDKNIIKANQLLGYPYFFEGFIVRGNQIGRTIGFPTANLRILNEEKLIPANGVYAVRVHGKCFGQKIYDGMMNIGIRPTVDGQKKVIEVHIFNFDEDIYENTITVSVYDFIRGEEKFSGLEALKHQLNLDQQTSSTILQKYP